MIQQEQRPKSSLRWSLRVWATWTALAVAAEAQAPAGFYTVKDQDSGFEFHCPNAFQAVPMPPGEPVIMARYLGKKEQPDRRSRTKNSAPTILVVCIDKPAAPITRREGDAEQDEAEAAPPMTAAEAELAQLQVHSFQEFLDKRLKDWEVSRKEKGKDRRRDWMNYSLSKEGNDQRGLARIYDQGRWILGFVGITAAAQFGSLERTLEKSAASLKAIERSAKDLEKLERHYRLRPEYKDPEFRIARHLELVRGWKAVDTPNYLIIHHTKDTSLLARIQNDLEAMRLLYEELFPPAQPVEAVSVVRVCKDREEYLAYGGWARSAGYWNSRRQELVLYDNVAGSQGSRFGNKDSYIVLYHEAFHQYIHYAAGELPPHSWFNEGYGDYFSGAVVYHRSKKVKKIGPNPWRVARIRAAVEADRHVPLEKLVHAEKKEYYKDGPLYYAEGWSFVYFLNTDKAAQRRKDWQAILPTYFETLKASYFEKLQELAEDATLEVREIAGATAREVAVEAAFQGVDYEELEAAWKKFVLKLRP
jgi:hypothetical protein